MLVLRNAEVQPATLLGQVVPVRQPATSDVKVPLPMLLPRLIALKAPFVASLTHRRNSLDCLSRQSIHTDRATTILTLTEARSPSNSYYRWEPQFGKSPKKLTRSRTVLTAGIVLVSFGEGTHLPSL